MAKLLLALLPIAGILAQESDDFFVVLHRPGPKWEAKAPFDRQPGIADHVKYWAALQEKGTVAQGGPFTDGQGGMMVLRGVKKEDAEKLAAEDPAVKSGLLAAEVHPWKRVLQERGPALLDPSDPRVNRKAPAEFRVKLETSRGDVVVKVVREWSPRGADRFYNLVRNGFYDGCRFFRVIPGFVAQFGINGDPKVAGAWDRAGIQDDPVVQGNERGYLSFATAGPNTRTTQLFINTKDNRGLDRMGFSPFGEVTEGMKVVDELYSGYGEGPPGGGGPDQGRITREGNPYLEKDFPKLDFIKAARIVE